jgi:undecaprenyl diphosphate synthase
MARGIPIWKESFEMPIHQEGGARHVGLIPDGIRRWGRLRQVSLADAYSIAMDRIAETTDAIFDHGATSVSIYLLSKENLQRTQAELAVILSSELDFVNELIPSVAAKWCCSVSHAGDPEILPTEYREGLKALVRGTSANAERSLNLLAGYDPIHEFLRAARLSAGVDDVVSQLMVPDRVDLVIRTGCVRRLSGFLPIQTAYAELFFVDELFPDVTRRHVSDAFEFFSGRDRRFGK